MRIEPVFKYPGHGGRAETCGPLSSHLHGDFDRFKHLKAFLGKLEGSVCKTPDELLNLRVRRVSLALAEPQQTLRAASLLS